MNDTTFVPPLRDLPSGHLEARRDHLLEEIERTAKSPWRFRPTRSRRSLVAALATVGALAAAGVAIAAAFGAFYGIGAAQHPPTGADNVDPATAAYLKEHLVGIQLDTARHIGRLPDGHNVYVVTGTQHDLCTVVGPPSAFVQCGDPLSDAHPTTITGAFPIDNDPAARWFVFGLALDGVTSVTFQPDQGDDGATGPAVTVPVTDNLWIYRSDDAQAPDALQPFTAHFADGTNITEPATGQNCAAC